MYPIIYSWELFGFQRVIAGYGLCLSAGILFGIGVAAALAYRRGLDPIDTLVMAVVAVGAGVLGSYLLFILTMIKQAIHNPSILLQGGLVFFGGPLAAIPAALIMCRIFNLPPLKAADIAAPALSLGHALGRMGCFLGGCCFGRQWEGPWAVTFTHPMAPAAAESVSRHPVQLYESLVLLGVSLMTMLVWRRTTHDGQVALTYVIAYAVWRFFVEMLRADDIRGHLIPGLLSTSQTISVLMIPAGIIGLYMLHRKRRPVT